MTTAPAAKSVARSRYWLAAAIRLAAGVMAAWSAANAATATVAFVLGLVQDATVSPSTTVGQRFVWFWGSGGSDVLWLVGSVVAFVKARSIAASIFPTVGVHCAKCGYSRRGLVTTAPCPECGTRAETQGAER